MTPKLQKIVDLVNDKGIEAVAKMMGIDFEELLDVLFNSDVIQYIDFDQYQLMDDTEVENKIWTYLLNDESTYKNAIETIANSFSDISFDGKDYYYEVRDKEDMADYFSDSGRDVSSYDVAKRVFKEDYDEIFTIDWKYIDLMDDVYDKLTDENKQYLRNRIVENYGKDLIGVPIENVTDVIERIGTEDENGDYEFYITNENVMDLFSDNDTMTFLFDNYLDDVARELHLMYDSAYNGTYYDEVSNDVWEELEFGVIDPGNKYGEEFYYNKKIYTKFKVTKSLPKAIKQFVTKAYHCDSVFNYGSYDYLIQGLFSCSIWERLSFRIPDSPDYTSLKQNLNSYLKEYI
jgi:hypothetical protein